MSAPPVEEQPGQQPPPQFAQNQPGQPPVPPNAPGVYQPQAGGGGVPANCPPGLEYLTQIDQLLVQQQVELLEAFVGFETSNKYVVKNTLGQQVYFAAEDTNCCTRNCCGNKRCFDMKILDNTQKEVIHLHRDLRCSTCWCPCFLQKMEVQSPVGTTIGYVCQSWSPCYPKYAIQDAKGETVLRIEGPLCTCNCCGDVEFDVMSEDGSSKVGKISKQWTGIIKEHFTDADNFGINFPMDLDVNVKATLLGACFLIDFMYFERSGGDKDQKL